MASKSGSSQWTISCAPTSTTGSWIYTVIIGIPLCGMLVTAGLLLCATSRSG